MSMKEDLKRAGSNIKDAAKEVKHRGTAEAELMRRDLLGDDMSIADKAKSTWNEAKNRGKAEIDRAKRETRERMPHREEDENRAL